jgi:hypothetical protein
MLSIVRDGHRMPAHAMCDSSGAVQACRPEVAPLLLGGVDSPDAAVIAEACHRPAITISRYGDL